MVHDDCNKKRISSPCTEYPFFHCHSYSANAHPVILAYTDHEYPPNAAGCLLPDEPDGAAADEVEQVVFAVGENQNVPDLAEHAGVAERRAGPAVTETVPRPAISPAERSHGVGFTGVDGMGPQPAWVA